MISFQIILILLLVYVLHRYALLSLTQLVYPCLRRTKTFDCQQSVDIWSFVIIPLRKTFRHRLSALSQSRLTLIFLLVHVPDDHSNLPYLSPSWTSKTILCHFFILHMYMLWKYACTNMKTYICTMGVADSALWLLE